MRANGYTMTYPSKTSKRVGVYDVNWKLVKVCFSMSEAARFIGCRVQNVYKVCNGYKSTLNGYNLKFLEV